MASIFGHAVGAFAIGSFSKPVMINRKVLTAGTISSMLPDADMIAFKLGIPYSHMFGHRGFTHSLFFALIWALVLWFFLHRGSGNKNRNIFVLYYFLCTASHGILDAMTTGGRGIAFFAPFSDERMFLPWRVIQVSPLQISDFFGEWGWKVIQSECIWILLPSILIVAFNKWMNY